jgi:hypothetical protein
MGCELTSFVPHASTKNPTIETCTHKNSTFRRPRHRLHRHSLHPLFEFPSSRTAPAEVECTDLAAEPSRRRTWKHRSFEGLESVTTRTSRVSSYHTLYCTQRRRLLLDPLGVRCEVAPWSANRKVARPAHHAALQPSTLVPSCTLLIAHGILCNGRFDAPP